MTPQLVVFVQERWPVPAPLSYDTDGKAVDARYARRLASSRDVGWARGTLAHDVSTTLLMFHSGAPRSSGRGGGNPVTKEPSAMRVTRAGRKACSLPKGRYRSELAPRLTPWHEKRAARLLMDLRSRFAGR